MSISVKEERQQLELSPLNGHIIFWLKEMKDDSKL